MWRQRIRERSSIALRQLLLMRHAKSLWDDPKLSDHARPLNGRGRAAATAMGRTLRDLGLQPDIILVSSARRTLQTLEALGRWDRTPLIEPMDALYLASAAALLDVLHAVTEPVHSVMLLGHNPGMHELAMTLVGAQAFTRQATEHEPTRRDLLMRLAEGYPTGALCEFTVPSTWNHLGEGGGQLQRFILPRDLDGSG
jgi:phosphohistidine phosphatase